MLIFQFFFFLLKKMKHIGGEHSKEKLYRYNYLCPRCHVMELIKGDRFPTEGCMPLCIDNCDNCPLKKKLFEPEEDWWHIAHHNMTDVSGKLDKFVSVYVKRDKMAVIENTILFLKVDVTTIRQGKLEVLCNAKWTIK
ncbi:hypothetical protein RFI_27708, partial [Reticulomyxa filosa]